MNMLPSTFCWTKIGPEAGEDLAAIRCRKEWERQLGRGQFFWGIGQSLGENAHLSGASGAALRVLFSPMPSKPKAIDSTPAGIVLWNAWVDGGGCAQPLPDHCLITSRSCLPSGKAKERHYALVCTSDEELGEQLDCWVSPQHLRNIGTNSSLGASQVTAVVRLTGSTGLDEEARRYPVSFAADLKPPYFVRLSEPTPLAASDVAQIRAVCAVGDIESWRALVSSLRSRTRPASFVTQDLLNFGPPDGDALRQHLAPRA